jgi:hypothetical protein
MGTLLVWNFSKDTSTDDLKYVFGVFGDVCDVRFAKGRAYAL